MPMQKIAFVCDNDQTISAHFGRAPLAVVVTLDDDGAEIEREVRKKAHHSGEHAHHHHADHHEHGTGHGHGNPHEKFAAMSDCDVIIVRGIGRHAQAHAEAQAQRLLLIDEPSIEAALTAYRGGTLVHNPNRAH